jgi:hypothetical protein
VSVSVPHSSAAKSAGRPKAGDRDTRRSFARPEPNISVAGRVGGQRFFFQKIFSPCSVSARAAFASLAASRFHWIRRLHSTAQLLAWGRCALTLTSTAGGVVRCTCALSLPSAPRKGRPLSITLWQGRQAVSGKPPGQDKRKKKRLSDGDDGAR